MLASMEAESVNCCVTSPPYWGLRDYGVAGQLGLEKTPEEYVDKLVAVFREVRRVLRKDGTLWLNLGDCYASAGGAGWQGKHGARANRTHTQRPLKKKSAINGLKPKDLIGIPWRVAFALQADGWWLRSDIVWNKPNPMPESTIDRPTKAHEYIFLFAKSAHYHYDRAGGSERCISPEYDRIRMREGRPRKAGKWFGQTDPRFSATRRAKLGVCNKVGDGETRNRRTVWTVTTKPFPGAHFATFPPDLIEPCVLAGCPPRGVVLDPFFGAGTTGLVALKHGRECIGIELNPEYVKIAEERLREVQTQFGGLDGR